MQTSVRADHCTNVGIDKHGFKFILGIKLDHCEQLIRSLMQRKQHLKGKHMPFISYFLKGKGDLELYQTNKL